MLQHIQLPEGESHANATDSLLFGGSIRLCCHGVVTRSDVGRQRWGRPGQECYWTSGNASERAAVVTADARS
jgi:hypothetical protein